MGKVHFKFNTENFKSRLFVRLFGSYVVIIVCLFLIYSAVVVMENVGVHKEQRQQYYQLKLSELKNVLDVQLVEADTVISNINTSDIIRRYSSGWSDRDISAADVINEIRVYTLSTNNVNIYDTVLYFEGSDKLYTSAQLYTMYKAYNGERDDNINGIRIDSINSLYGLRNNELIMNKEWFMYSDDYSTLFADGTVSVLFNADLIMGYINSVFENESGYAVYINDRCVCGEEISDAVTFEDNSSVGSVRYRLDVSSKNFGLDINGYFIAALIIAFVVAVAFVIMAFAMADSYYKPLGNIEKIIDETVGGAESEDEFANIITGIQGLIGERNGYKERMIKISPYVQQGVLHGIVSGNLEADSVKVLSQQEYTVLQKPYYIISVINAAYIGNGKYDKDIFRQVKNIISNTVEKFADDERSLYIYDRDRTDTYLIINMNECVETENLIYDIFNEMSSNIHNDKKTDKVVLTFGVDEVREDLSQLHEACSNAVKALGGMAAGGREAVYFYEKEVSSDRQKYYFPKDSVNILTRALKDRKLEDIRKFFKNILEENTKKYELSSATVQLLVDEVHITTVKVIKNVNPDDRVDFSIEKLGRVATLEEILEYYYAIYQMLADKLDEIADDKQEADELDRKIIKCINEQYMDSNLSLQYLTERFGVSNKYISLMCKKHLGVTYLQYVQEKRIRAAIELMETTDDALEVIAGKVGYTNILTFRRNFKTVMGVNPSEYKK